jgi:hypothetical protein
VVAHMRGLARGEQTVNRASIAAVAALALLVTSLAHGQFFRRRASPADNTPPPTEFIGARWKFGTNGAIGHMGWSHNYPDSEINLNEFIGRTTRVDVEDDSYRLLELSNPQIFDYPFAYVSEPGEMALTEAEVANLREYVERGGFILIDDFDTWHMDNLRGQMLRVFPDRVFQRLTVDEPMFDLVYTVEDLDALGDYSAGDDPVYYGLVNSAGHIAVVACHNNDLANFWEWYGSPQYPLKPSTDAFRLGTNFVMHSMTH